MESLWWGGRKFDSEIENLILYWGVGALMFFVDREFPIRGYMSGLTFILSKFKIRIKYIFLTHLLLPSYAYLYLFYISLRVGAFDTMPRRRNGWIVAWNIDHLKLFDHVSIFGTFEKDKMTSPQYFCTYLVFSLY